MLYMHVTVTVSQVLILVKSSYIVGLNIYINSCIIKMTQGRRVGGKLPLTSSNQ